MGKTRDRFPGPSIEEETQYENRAAGDNPVDPGAIRYVDGSFLMLDSTGLFNPRDGTDDKVGASPTDTTPADLLAKLAAGSNITITLLNAGGNEQLEISSAGGIGDVLLSDCGIILWNDSCETICKG